MLYVLAISDFVIDAIIVLLPLPVVSTRLNAGSPPKSLS